MSRIGKLPVDVTKGVEVKVNDGELTVKGPNGSLTLRMLPKLKVEVKDNQIVITRNGNDKETRSSHGLYRSLVYNMVEGVSKGFEKKLMLSGVGYRGQMQGKKLVLQLGYSHPVEIDPPEGITVKVQGLQVIVSGASKEMVGQVAADIRATRAVEPYKAKGIKYEGEIVRRKAGKAAKAAGAAAK